MISLLTGGITVLNAATFILLAPGQELSDYISASVIYGTGAWLVLWVLPAAWNFDVKKLKELRAVQLLFTLAVAFFIIIIHPNLLGASLAGLLVLEYVFFFPHLLLYESRTRDYQKIELLRAALNSANMVTTLFLFAGRPTAYCATFFFLTLSIGAIAAFRYHRPPSLQFSLRHIPNLRFEIQRILKSKQLRFMLGARGLEISVLQYFNWTGNLGVQLCFKVGIAISQSLSSNAQARSTHSIMSVAVAVYFFSLCGIMLIWFLYPDFLPKSLGYINPNNTLMAAYFFIIHIFLILRSLRSF